MLDEEVNNDDMLQCSEMNNEGNGEKIYMDLDFNHLLTESQFNSESTVEQSQMCGIAKTQSNWQQMVKEAAESIVHEAQFDNTPFYRQLCEMATAQNDTRPRVFDSVAKTSILMDTGSAVTAWPKAYYPDAKLDTTCRLQAVNKSRIQTYGKVTRQIRIGRKTYNKEVIIADIPAPIIGWDFVKEFKLNFIWDAYLEVMYLTDRLATTRTKLQLEKVPFDVDLELKVEGVDSEMQWKTYQQYSQIQTQMANKKAVPEKIPAKYQAIVDKYPELQKENFQDGGKTTKHGVVHSINTGNSRPCTAKVRPLMAGSPKATKGKENWFELEKLGIIERVNAQECNIWTSALNLVPKPDGDLRVCGDFRPLNDATELDGYQLPNLRNFVGNLKGATIFSRLDLKKGYHHVPLDEDAQNKTTVVTPWGAFKFKRLAMGLRNSAQSFQRLMDTLFAGVEDVFVYMDDILIFSKNEKQHLETVKEVFKILDDNGLTISLKKCAFGQEELDYLGYRVNSKGITPLPRKLTAIAKFPEPTKPKSLLGFLGGVNYYRRALPKLNGKNPAEILQPLYAAATAKMTSAQFMKHWEENNLGESFRKAKEMLMQACQLAHPDPNAPLALTSDASKTAIGAVLEQYNKTKG